MINRENIIKEARSWLGTSFRYQGRVKKNSVHKGGVDCLGLILKVCDFMEYKYQNHLLSYYDTISYSFPTNYDILKAEFAKFFHIISISQINIGDIILQKVSKEQYHLMFYNSKTVIHASALVAKVVEHNFNNFNDCIIYTFI